MKFSKEQIRIYNLVRYHLYSKKRNTERVRAYRARKALQSKGRKLSTKLKTKNLTIKC